MDLKSAVEIAENICRGINQRPHDLTQKVDNQVLQTLLSFCETALKLQEVIPKKTEFKFNSSIEERERIGYNTCHAEMTAWIASRVNVERIKGIIKGNIMYDYTTAHCIKGAEDVYVEQLAQSIVDDILGRGRY